MIGRSLQSNYLTGTLGGNTSNTLFNLFVKSPAYRDYNVSETQTKCGVNAWKRRIGLFYPQFCFNGTRARANASSLGDCEPCEQGRHDIGPKGEDSCALPAAKAEVKLHATLVATCHIGCNIPHRLQHATSVVNTPQVKLDYLSKSLLQPSNDLVLRSVSDNYATERISIKARSEEFSFHWHVLNPSALPKSFSLGKLSGNVTAGSFEDIPINFIPSGLSGVKEGEVLRTRIIFGGESSRQNMPLTFNQLDVAIKARALPSIKRSKIKLRIDERTTTYNGQSFHVIHESLVDIQIEALAEDGFEIKGESKVWFVVTVWQVGKGVIGLYPVRYASNADEFLGRLAPKALVGQYKVWISEIRTRDRVYNVKPGISAACGLPSNTSIGCPPMVILVTCKATFLYDNTTKTCGCPIGKQSVNGVCEAAGSAEAKCADLKLTMCC